MNRLNRYLASVAFLAVAAVGASAQAASIVNNDFEAMQVARNSTNPTDIPGWTHTGDIGDALLWNVAYFDSSGTAHAGHGNQFVTIGGGPFVPGTGTWSTTITGLTMGKAYDLTFLIAHECSYCLPSQTVDVSLNGGPITAFTTTTSDPVSYWHTWEPESLDFVASGATESLSFTATTQFDVGLDYVNVTPTGVPEPVTWAMMLLGFGAIGCVARRRPSKARAVSA